MSLAPSGSLRTCMTRRQAALGRRRSRTLPSAGPALLPSLGCRWMITGLGHSCHVHAAPAREGEESEGKA